MNASRPIRVGLLGHGLAGRVFHAPLIEMTPGLELVGIATSNPGQVEQLLEEIDLCVIATPNRTHAELARAALGAGLHVVIDKPVARSAEEATTIADAADGAGRLAIPFHNRRWDADFRTLLQLVADGELGEIWRLESRFERWVPEVGSGWRERAGPDEAGGVLLDLGPHLIDQALQLLGPVEQVRSEIRVRRAGAATADDAFLALHHRGGAISHLWMSSVAADPGPRFRVLGSRAAYVKRAPDPQEDALKGGDWSGEDPDVGELVAGAARRAVPTVAGAWPEFYAGVVAAIRGEGPVPVEFGDAIAGLEILDAAQA